MTDSLPTGALANIPAVVVRIDRESSWNEQYIGLGTIFSVTDYGDAWSTPDDVMLAKWSEKDERPQACKVARELCPVCGITTDSGYVKIPDDTALGYRYSDERRVGKNCGHVADRAAWTVAALASHIVIVVTRGGWAPRAIFDNDVHATLDDAAREVPADIGRAIGMAIFAAGGNGTMAAAKLRYNQN